MSTVTTASITVNGEVRDLPLGLALPEVLRLLGLDPAQPGIAVALNGVVIRRADWPSTPVEAEDEVEIITATQGG